MNYYRLSEQIKNFIRDYFNKNNLKGVVIGISGGKDSAVVAGLFTKALGKENVTGIWMGCHSKEEDKKDAIKLANTYGFELLDFDLTNTYDNYVKQIKEVNNVSEEDLINSNINIKPRLRMTTLYYYSAMLSSLKGGTYIVAGTSNKCELYVGYFTKGGDNVSDIQVLADLSVRDVIELGKIINVPRDILLKTPDDGLSNQSDEEKLGVSYNIITRVMDNLYVEDEEKEKVLKLHNNSAHKFNVPTFYKK